MSNPKPHPKSGHSKSKVIYRSTQQGLSSASTSDSPTASAFSAANASLQNLSGTAVSAPSSENPATETKIAPVQLAKTARPDEGQQPQAREVELASCAVTTRAETNSSRKTPVQSVLPTQVVRDARTNRGVQSHGQRGWKTQPGIWLSAGLGALLLVAGGAAAGAYSNFASGGTIAPNVSISGVAVGGLTPATAKTRLIEHFGAPKIALLCDGKTVQMPIGKLGAKLSIEPTIKKAYLIGRDGSLPNNLLRVYGTSGSGKNFMLPIEWNKAQLLKGLSEINAKIAVKPVDARLRAAATGLEVVPDRAGRELNTGGAAHLLQRKFYVGLPSLHVPTREVKAKVSALSLEGSDVQLAQYTTQFNSGLAGRTENIRIAASAIENRVLMPGDTFSFNSCTGERTVSKGYRMAHIFLRQPGADESEVVEGLAGGVCQVSSTLFNAVRKTNAQAGINPIKIVQRSTHSLPVTYVPRGLDATVAWPYKDFKFENVTERPVYVRTRMSRSKLSVSIWSRLPRA